MRVKLGLVTEVAKKCAHVALIIMQANTHLPNILHNGSQQACGHFLSVQLQRSALIVKLEKVRELVVANSLGTLVYI